MTEFVMCSAPREWYTIAAMDMTSMEDANHSLTFTLFSLVMFFVVVRNDSNRSLSLTRTFAYTDIQEEGIRVIHNE